MSMIQFNLLPDVKLAYVKAQRQKQLVTSISTVAGIAAIAVFVLLFAFVNLAQKKSVNDLTKDIKTVSSDLMGTDDLNKILTVQNQLISLNDLHDNKVAAKRMLDYIQQVTPRQSTISQLEVDYSQNIMTINGDADALSVVNTFADALKFTTYRVGNEQEAGEKHAFSNVVLTNFSRTEEKTTYTLTMNFDPAIASRTEDVELVIPNMVTSRSNLERPDLLFQQSKRTP
jgi:hypothetical protein